MPAGWREEIVDLHAFFQAWLSGESPAGPESFARVEHALAPGFAMVEPGGRLVRREAVLSRLRDAHGARPGLEIRIDDVELRSVHGSVVLAVYVEWQRAEGRETRRVSSALLEAPRVTDTGATGWRWLHLHETWMDRT